MLYFFNILFTLAHLLLMVFNLFGWIWKPTRKAHLFILLLTAASWFVLGIWYGWGYCPLTDWHWEVKEKLGESNLPNSFVKYMVDKIADTDISSSLVDKITLACLVGAVIASVYVNFFAQGKKNNAT